MTVGCDKGPGGSCGRNVVGRGMCSSHYRAWRNGLPLDFMPRGYIRYAEGPDGSCVEAPIRPCVVRPDPFAREKVLLAKMGL